MSLNKKRILPKRLFFYSSRRLQGFFKNRNFLSKAINYPIFDRAILRLRDFLPPLYYLKNHASELLVAVFHFSFCARSVLLSKTVKK